MITGRRTTDWLREGQNAAEDGRDRRSDDRRSNDRRAPRRRFDPLFAATLIDQVAQNETPDPAKAARYAPPQPRARWGVALNTRA